MTAGTDRFADLVGLMRAEDLAAQWGYSGANNAFREFCAKLGVRHVPGRPGWFDPRHVRARLDAIQGMAVVPVTQVEGPGLVDKWRARRGAS